MIENKTRSVIEKRTRSVIGNKEKTVLENRDRDQCWKTKTRSVLENKVEISSKRKETLPAVHPSYSDICSDPSSV